MQTLNEIIDEHPFWKGLQPSRLFRLQECASEVRFGEQQQIFQEGATAECFYLIQWGRVALETFAPGKGVVTIQTIGAGEALGWSWLFPPYRWHFTARSVKETGAVSFDARRLREMAGADSGFGYNLAMRVAGVMLQRLQATRMQLLDFYGGQ